MDNNTFVRALYGKSALFSLKLIFRPKLEKKMSQRLDFLIRNFFCSKISNGYLKIPINGNSRTKIFLNTFFVWNSMISFFFCVEFHPG